MFTNYQLPYQYYAGSHLPTRIKKKGGKTFLSNNQMYISNGNSAIK